MSPGEIATQAATSGECELSNFAFCDALPNEELSAEGGSNLLNPKG